LTFLIKLVQSQKTLVPGWTSGFLVSLYMQLLHHPFTSRIKGNRKIESGALLSEENHILC
jgi:hypothetical protein